MSSRDLLQRRGTTFSGDTIWENSPLVKAAINGSLAVMDGIETLSFGTLATLQRLIKEREISLPDGKQLINHERYQNLVQKHGFTSEILANRGIFPINPTFRIVVLARPVSSGSGGSEGKPGAWLSPEVSAMFQFVAVRLLEYQEETEVLHALSPGVNEKSLELLLRFANRLRQDTDETIKILSDALSTRQLIRICRRITAFPDESLYDSIHKASLSRFLPSLAKEALEEIMIENGITPPNTKPKIEELKIEVFPSVSNPEYLQIGNIKQPIAKDSNPLLVPDNLLLIGNQGVGKNKLVDYFLQLLKLPREYIQLHRDTTVQSLTSTPSIIDGVLQHEDSPLVKAVKSGYILVIDEADKAPTYVTAVLRNLIEDGEMVLGDGRRIVSRVIEKLENDNEDEYILVHKNFRIIVLANRPGNDFYREIGDVFSCHAVDNPDPASEMYLLLKYAPDISQELLLKLTAAFSDLRRLVDEGLISYPYSTRELVNIVKHMQQYPKEGVSQILQNVFDFDQYDKDSKVLLIETFQKHGIPIGLNSELSVQLGKFVSLSEPVVTEIWTKATASRQRTLQVSGNKIELRGGWEFHVNKTKELERTEGRTTTFTEQIYSFKIPTRGEALDIVGLEDGSLFAVTTNPITLHHIDKEHHLSKSVELYEYFPLKDVPPRIKLAIVQAHGSAWFLTLHDPENNSVVVMDYIGRTVNSIKLTGLAKQTRKIMVKDFASLGILVFYQFFKSSIVVLDFNSNTEYMITLPINVAQLYLLKPDIWLVRDCANGSYHIIYPTARNTEWQAKLLLPNVIEQIEIKNLSADLPHQPITFMSQDGVPRANVSSARFLHTKNDTFALSIASNLPESLISNKNDIKPIEIVSYTREPEDNARNLFENIGNSSLFLTRTGQLATVIPVKNGRNCGYLELFNPVQQTLWRIVIPLAIPVSIAEKSKFSQADLELQQIAALLLELPNGDLLTMDNSGVVRVWQVNAGELIRAADTWKKFVGVLDQHVLSIIYETDEIQEENLANGNKSGVGTGGSEEFKGREPTFIDVDNLILRDEAKTPLELTEAQKEMHTLVMRQRLEQITMTQSDSDIYRGYLANVQREIRELRVILEGIEAKKKERVWLKSQSSGDIDDTKLIEGLTGDHNIYKRRGENDPEIGFFQEKPKKMYFVFDLSASMHRFNTHDRRLDRSIEVALMIMESFKSFENKFEYRIVGHSGDSPNVEFVTHGKYPKTEKDIFKVLKEMFTHSQFYNTLNAASHAIKDIVKEQADDYFVVVLSDANISQYNIKPDDIAKVLKSDERVSAFMIFIGSLQDQAEKLRKNLAGHAHICMENSELPRIMKSIFLSSMLK
ncbi:1372_t:CDS:10 [Ambispora gerdemannii]|uniref:1372_t:CDS:1 n=1 Tax=Ambispora gerdemannii TaxID=144530 RepID=A0A9N8ZTB8_9GLOM|nr:1372_t:CDS:10 [Ambispora gerdemannii]